VRTFVATAVLAAALVFAAAARAATPYWFFQGWLPRFDGTRTVHHALASCCQTNWMRMNFWPPNHYMNFILIAKDGRWLGFHSFQTDNVLGFEPSTYSRGGCQNPTAFFDQIYTNCHIGTSY
jgi:hypothetical protein